MEDEEMESTEEEEEVQELVDKLRQHESSIEIDWDAFLTALDSEMPKIPARPVVEQINPPPYA